MANYVKFRCHFRRKLPKNKALGQNPAGIVIYAGVRSVDNKKSRRIISLMHDIPNRIADVLLEVEASLRVHGKWDEHKPQPSDLGSTFPFCMDTLKFEQWLQWIFLPRMKDTLEKTKPLPAQSAIFEYAEECLHKRDPSTDTLLKQLKTFDDLITIQAGVLRH